MKLRINIPYESYGRDTACSQTIILASLLPFSDQSAWNYGSVLRGVEMGYVPRPVHQVHVISPLITGFYPIAVCPELPVEGISFLVRMIQWAVKQRQLC